MGKIDQPSQAAYNDYHTDSASLPSPLMASFDPMSQPSDPDAKQQESAVTPLHIWVDADACPNAIKEIIFRAAKRTSCPLTLVANHPVQVPAYAEMLVVPSGFDGADNKIVELLNAGDLVITADIPLAAKVLDKGGYAFNPRGEEYTSRNIGERLSVRNFLESFRGGAEPVGGGPPPLNNRDKATFANQLDRFLAKHKS